jgi:hypothetical protein
MAIKKQVSKESPKESAKVYEFVCRRFPRYKVFFPKGDPPRMLEFQNARFTTTDLAEVAHLRKNDEYGSALKEIGVHDQFDKAKKLVIELPNSTPTLDDIRDAILRSQIKASGLDTSRNSPENLSDAAAREDQAADQAAHLTALVDEIDTQADGSPQKMRATQGVRGTGARRSV